MDSIKARARRAGGLYFLFLILGLIDIYGFSHFVVAGNATATAANITGAELTFRLGILIDLITLIVFIPLVVSLYGLLKDVDNWHARVMVLLVSIGVAIGFVNTFNKMVPLMLLSGATGYLSAFTRAQLEALSLVFLTLNTTGNTVVTAFWGLWLIPFGILVVKSGFFPRILGILLMVAGFGNLTTSIVSILFPQYEQIISKLMMPLVLGEFPMIFWLLIKGAKISAEPHVASNLQ